MSAYFRWLQMQGDNTVLKNGQIHWGLINYDLIDVWPHYMRSGLQLADVVASAFFRGCDLYNTGKIQPELAKALGARMAIYRDRRQGLSAGYGVKIMPSFWKAKLLPKQQDTFEFYGYPEEW